MENLILLEDELIKAGYKNNNSNFFYNDKALLYIHPIDGVYVAFREGFDRWATDRLNDIALSVPYTNQELEIFFQELGNILNGVYV